MKFLSYTLFLLLIVSSSSSFEKQPIRIAFYNVENLFDTENDPGSNDNAYLPTSKLEWTLDKYRSKLGNISKVLAELNPDIAGLCEVENAKVLKDLIQHQNLSSKKYSFIHLESEDVRGIDVAFIYKKEVFTPLFYTSFSVKKIFDNVRITSRDILMVKGIQGKDTIHYFVNHWPSRRSGGKLKSENKRVALAMLARELVDSILSKNNEAKIVLMGDFNDEPKDESLSTMLLAKKQPVESDENELINPFYSVPPTIGSHKYRNKWYCYDQILFSESLIKKYVKNSAAVYHPIWMHYNENMSNGPFRTYLSAKYQGGYSDHFPVFILFKD